VDGSNGGVTLRGQGADATVLRMAPGSGRDVLTVGFRRLAIEPGEIRDVTALFDGTTGRRLGLVSGLKGADLPQQRWGTSRILAFAGTPLDLGPRGGWSSLDALTIELATIFDEPADARRAVPLAGLSHGAAVASPFLIFEVGDQILVKLAGGLLIQGAVPDFAKVGVVHRVTLQIDLKASAAILWADGRRVGSVALPPDYRFPGDTIDPLLLGAQGETFGSGSNAQYFGAAFSQTFCGLHLRTDAPYADDGDGQPQRRKDDAPATDLARYFTRTPATLGLLPMQVAPDERRLVAGEAMSGTDIIGFDGRWIDPAFHQLDFAGSRFACESLSLVGGRMGYGTTLAIYQGTDDRLVNVRAYGAAWGLCFPKYTTTSYHHEMSRLELEGADCALYAFGCFNSRLTDLKLGSMGRWGVYLDRSALRVTGGLWTGWVANAQVRPLSVFRLDRSDLIMAGTMWDNEGGDWPTVAGIEVHGGGANNGGMANLFELSDHQFAMFPATVPPIRIMGPVDGTADADDAAPNTIRLGPGVRYQARPGGAPLLRVDAGATSWTGEVSSTLRLPPGVPMVDDRTGKGGIGMPCKAVPVPRVDPMPDGPKPNPVPDQDGARAKD
jgi:hypothetical protein